MRDPRTCSILVGKPEGRRQLGRRRCRWEDNIKMYIREVGWGLERDRSGSRYGKLVGACECCNELLGSINCGEFFFLPR